MLKKFEQINPHACKTYLIADQNNDIVLIDPVLDHLKDYLSLIKNNNYNLKYIIDTHTHADHISCGSALKDIVKCRYIMHKKSPVKCADFRIEEELTIELLDKIKFSFIFTPGHTRDSISVLIDDKLLTGDVLFLDDGGAGRDDLPGGDPAAHWESLQKILQLDENIIVYPAHDYRKREPSSLKKQKVDNPHLKHSTKEDFIHYVEDLKLGPADWMKDVLKANYACAQDPQAAWIPVDTPACEIKGTIDKNINEINVDLITPQELDQIIKKEDNFLLLDVREPEELSDSLGHIEGVENIPILSISKNLDKIKPYKTKEIYVICRSGHRAYTAGQILKKAGFEKVKVLQDGMIGWNNIISD